MSTTTATASTTISGISLDLDSAAAAVARTWQAPLEQAAQSLLDRASTTDSRLQAIFSVSGLAPIFTALIQELCAVLGELTATLADTTGVPLQSTVDECITRYLESLVSALDLLVTDWDALGPIFFTSGEGTSAISHQLSALVGVVPQPGASAQGGKPDLLLQLQLTRSGQTGASPLSANLLRLPRDVTCDCTLIGNTTHLCGLRGGYAFAQTTCEHPWCHSIAERIGNVLGELNALPTLKIWPASPTTSLAFADTAYGYREYLPPAGPSDTQVTSAQASASADFSRTLGRLLALAHATGCEKVGTSDFTVHQLRPYWTNPRTVFGFPARDLSGTGMFTAQTGPLSSTAAAPRLSTKAGAADSPVPLSVPDVCQGCNETLDALGSLAPELSKRLLGGPNVVSRFVPRSPASSATRTQQFLQVLSAASSWGDWTSLDRYIAQWRTEDEAIWTARWFGGLLGQLQPTLSLWPPTSTEAATALAALRDEVVGAVGCRSFQALSVETIASLPASTREPVWKHLSDMAAILGGYLTGKNWLSYLETDTETLPLTILVDHERASHARAQTPYFIRLLQQASLWSATDGAEITLHDVDAPPPRLQRSTFFPESAAQAIARTLNQLSNPGIRSRLLASLPSLLGGKPSSVPPAPLPVGPPLTPVV